MGAGAGSVTVVNVAVADSGYAALEICDNAGFDQVRDLIEITSYGDTSPKKLAGLKKFSGTLDFFRDETAAAQVLVRAALANGTDLWIEILPDGTHGAKCACKISAISTKGGPKDAVKCSAKFEENGAWATV